jgi:hypothetical protein
VQGRARRSLQSLSQSQFQHQRLSARWTSSKPRSGSNSGGSGSGSGSGNNRTRDLVISGVSVCCVLGALYYFEQSKAKAAASRNADKAVGKVCMAVCVCVCGLVVYVVWRHVMWGVQCCVLCRRYVVQYHTASWRAVIVMYGARVSHYVIHLEHYYCRPLLVDRTHCITKTANQ